MESGFETGHRVVVEFRGEVSFRVFGHLGANIAAIVAPTTAPASVLT